ncbi:MAG: 50S ribosomal protein L6 [Candidatus Omnitrophica bacterium]|nr:50S ribosomal protein L6 [Candidatus Omnitrophota bacterium]MDD5436800.1 50S ribosomal protein L6 [Candidatus Omnitrophota bacterium]
MSRIGKKPVAIPGGVKAAVSANTITVEGPKGKLSYSFKTGFKVEVKDKAITITRPSDAKQDKATHGLIRSLVNNMIIGVTEGYKKELEITGVGFKAAMQGKVLNLQLSYSHPINYAIPDGITVETPKPNLVTIKGIDKAKVGEVAAEIRDFYRPEPYKGKGIKYVGEHVRRKAGKAVAGAGGPGGA